MAILSLYCMNTILFGNGFNLLSPNCPSWDALLSRLSNTNKGHIIKDVPPTLQYEQVYLNPKRNPCCISENDEETKLKEAVKRSLQKIEYNQFYEKLASLDINTFLTTNYDNTFYKNDISAIKNQNNSERLYSIRRWKKVVIEGREKTFFHIHGDISFIKSIMLGIDHYGGSLAKIQDYVKNNYQRKTPNKTYDIVPSIIRRIENPQILNDSKSYGFTDNGSGLLSWIDAFFITNLHIIGLSLDFSEIDLWWLLSRRARLMKNGKLDNKIYYYPTFPLSEIHIHLPKLRLLEKLNVNIIYHHQLVDIISGQNDYGSIYNEQLDNLSLHL